MGHSMRNVNPLRGGGEYKDPIVRPKAGHTGGLSSMVLYQHTLDIVPARIGVK